MNSVIDKAKEEYKCNTSEKLFNINEPPDHQCPNIDSIISDIKKVIEMSERRDYDDSQEEAKDRLFDIEHQLWHTEDELEDLRSNIESLRAWGQEWKDFAKQLVEDNFDRFEDIEGV